MSQQTTYNCVSLSLYEYTSNKLTITTSTCVLNINVIMNLKKEAAKRNNFYNREILRTIIHTYVLSNTLFLLALYSYDFLCM